MSKQAFEFARNSMWSVDPDDLCIIGGQALLDAERGPLDTTDGPEHDLYDPRILLPLEEPFVLNIDAHGVDTPILIAKIDGVAVVIAGKTRVRAARWVNKRRLAHGEPTIKVDCKMKREKPAGLLGAMIRENEARRDDDIPAKIEKLKKYMNRGGSIQSAAPEFNVGVQTIKDWLAFDDNAIAPIKNAVADGRLAQSSAAVLARLKDPTRQQKALDDLLSTGGRATRRQAHLAVQQNADKRRVVGVTDKKTIRKLLETVQNVPHRNANEKTLAFYEGAEEALKLVLGAETDARLAKKLDEVYAILKHEERAQAKRPKKRSRRTPRK